MEELTSDHHHLALGVPPGLNRAEFSELTSPIQEFHSSYTVVQAGKCSSLLAQRINAPRATVWSILRRFDKPHVYKHFIKSCSVSPDFQIAVGCIRYVDVISGLPALTSTERLDILDDERFVTGFSIIGGEHRLRNYRSVSTVHEVAGASEGEISTVVLESYVVDVPEGNTEEDTRLFADTVVKLNLLKLASVAEALAREKDANTLGG
ncbi:hypothetical protein SAY86_020164 [Trapa natans]|uniref:Uncharacterized protein n=1 Tax=Trapa natans TaxID=22666 RepID=A0AAN7M0U9_TRANT|nr:hypothetical protein SAY86_020164 [Trapa natans]